MKLLSIIALTAMAGEAAAQAISAQQTVNNINGITSMSSALDKTAKGVTLLNAFNTGPEVIKGFHGIVKTATRDYNAMRGGSNKRDLEIEENNAVGSPAARAALEVRQSTTYTEAEQTAVCNAFIDFVKVHQALLATVIGKHGILEVSGVAYQMAAVLRGVEGVVDEIAFTLIAEVPHCAAKATAQKKNLDMSLQKSISTYADGLP